MIETSEHRTAMSDLLDRACTCDDFLLDTTVEDWLRTNDIWVDDVNIEWSQSLDEDAAYVLGLAVFAAHVVALERMIESVRQLMIDSEQLEMPHDEWRRDFEWQAGFGRVGC